MEAGRGLLYQGLLLGSSSTCPTMVPSKQLLLDDEVSETCSAMDSPSPADNSPKVSLRLQFECKCSRVRARR